MPAQIARQLMNYKSAVQVASSCMSAVARGPTALIFVIKDECSTIVCVGIMTPNAAEVKRRDTRTQIRRGDDINYRRGNDNNNNHNKMTSKVYTTIKFEWERTDIIDEEMTVSSRQRCMRK